MRLTAEEVKKRIREIGNEIETKLKKVVVYDDAGRGGKRCYLPTGKKGVTLAVIGLINGYGREKNNFLIAFEVGNAVLRESRDKTVADRLREAILGLEGLEGMLGEQDSKFKQENPKVCSYTLDNFEKLWGFLQEVDLGLKDSEPRGKKLFLSDEFDASKIIARYRCAIEKEDQVLLDLARRLLEADDWDHFISVNIKQKGYAEREHIVPCHMIHWKIIDMIYPADPVTGKRNLIEHGDVEEEIANLIKRNLKIVHISESERHKLDVTLGWKTTMPKEWGWGKSPYARLIAAGVPVRNAHVRDLEDEEWNENRLILIDDAAAGAGE